MSEQAKEQINSDASANRETDGQPFKKKLLDLLVCGICLDLLEDPHGLDCGHSYCGECLLSWFEQSKICPSCNAPAVRQPVSNHTLYSIVELCTEQEDNNTRRLTREDWQPMYARANETEYVFDSDDDVARCVTCHWELNEDYVCERCELRYRAGPPRNDVGASDAQGSSDEEEDGDLSDFVVSDSHELDFDDDASDRIEDSFMSDDVEEDRSNNFGGYINDEASEGGSDEEEGEDEEVRPRKSKRIVIPDSSDDEPIMLLSDVEQEESDDSLYPNHIERSKVVNDTFDRHKVISSDSDNEEDDDEPDYDFTPEPVQPVESSNNKKKEKKGKKRKGKRKSKKQKNKKAKKE